MGTRRASQTSRQMAAECKDRATIKGGPNAQLQHWLTAGRCKDSWAAGQNTWGCQPERDKAKALGAACAVVPHDARI